LVNFANEKESGEKSNGAREQEENENHDQRVRKVQHGRNKSANR
jgi:hypothetical protein